MVEHSRQLVFVHEAHPVPETPYPVEQAVQTFAFAPHYVQCVGVQLIQLDPDTP